MSTDGTDADSLYDTQAMDDQKKETPWQIRMIAYFMFCLLLLLAWISFLHYTHRGDLSARQKLHETCTKHAQTQAEFEACICTDDDCKEHHDG